MSKKKTPTEKVETGPWNYVQGSITREGAFTVFRLVVASPDGKVYGQRVDVATARLDRFPEVYKRTLDHLVRDIGNRV